MKKIRFVFFFSIALFITINTTTNACTNFLVTKGASKDGSVIITYTCDGEFHPHLRYLPAQDFAPGQWYEINNWDGTIRGKIKQVLHTYAVVGLMNEHQLAIAETTFDGRLELQNPDGLLHYWELMKLALQRTKTAREAIKVITELVDEYGYRSTGESFSIADKEEAWILEMIGSGKKGKGAAWVAVKVPDGYVSCHANKARIGTFPMDDPDNCLYSDNVISLAIEKGYYSPDSGKPFRFNEAYCPSTPRNRRYADTRVWSMLRRSAPSLNLSSDFHRAVNGSEPYPLWVKPDEKLSLNDVFSIMRDHYENTEFDMTKGIDAGSYGTPNRWRPIDWKIDSVEYAWERPISTQQTGFSCVSQCRSWMPNEIGGVYWYGVDDTYTTCYIPLYCSITGVPKPFSKGNITEFSWDSAWWVFNFVANYANIKYSYMIQDIHTVQKEIENNFIKFQPAIDNAATGLLNTDKNLAAEFLTNYAFSQTDWVMNKWRELGELLITKYNDGYIKNDKGRPKGKGYPETWLRNVIKLRPEQFLLKEKDEHVPESRLID